MRSRSCISYPWPNSTNESTTNHIKFINNAKPIRALFCCHVHEPLRAHRPVWGFMHDLLLI